jgi:hypothetical protein
MTSVEYIANQLTKLSIRPDINIPGNLLFIDSNKELIMYFHKKGKILFVNNHIWLYLKRNYKLSGMETELSIRNSIKEHLNWKLASLTVNDGHILQGILGDTYKHLKWKK